MHAGTPLGTPPICELFFGLGLGLAVIIVCPASGAACAGFGGGGGGGGIFFFAAGLLAFPCAIAWDEACTTSTNVATAVIPNVTSFDLIFSNLRWCASAAHASRVLRDDQQSRQISLIVCRDVVKL
jgi:hypothetical protein